VWGDDKTNQETYGRLLQHPTGWTYDHEYNEWVDYLEIFTENAITMHLEADIKRKRERFQLVVLVLSSCATLVTSTSLVFREQEKAREQTSRMLTTATRLCPWSSSSSFSSLLS